MYTIVRHAQQTNFRLHDPHIKPVDLGDYQYTFDYIIASPYLRTRETAEKLNHDNKPIYIDPRLSEYHGHKKGTTLNLSDETKQYGDIPGYEENWEEFTARVNDFYEWLVQQNANILIVTHGIVVNYLYEIITGETLEPRARDVPFAKGFIIVNNIK